MTAAIRFWARVSPPDENGCWIWKGALNADGYGRFHSGDGDLLAHRYSWFVANGRIPDGLELDHVKERGCRSRACVNPEHLEPVTHAENIRRGGIAESNHLRSDPSIKTHCINGHLRSEDNLYRFPDGRRACRTCRKVHGRRKKVA